jgi:hypothetical protein
MNNMLDKVELQMLRQILEEKHQSMLTHAYMIDDLMSEILILDDPSSMREVAMYVKEVVKQMEGI